MRSSLAAVFLFVSVLSVSLAESFTFSAERLESIQAKGKERTILTGNASIVSKNTTIRADRIEIFGDNNRYALCSGSVVVEDTEREIRLESASLFYDRERELSRVEGYAEMQDRKNEIVVKGNYLEHAGDTEVTLIQIGVRILKATDDEEMAARAEFARYRRNEDVLELSGLPRVVWKGDEYRATRITIDLENDRIILDGKVSGTIRDQEEEASEGAETGAADGG